MNIASVGGGIPVDSATVLSMGIGSGQSLSAKDLNWESPGRQMMQYEGTETAKDGIPGLLFNDRSRANICFSDSSLALVA